MIKKILILFLLVGANVVHAEKLFQIDTLKNTALKIMQVKY